jgi:predicted P-loop ATPase
MQTEKLVFSSLFKKEELATQKVELASLSDLKTVTENAKKNLDLFNKSNNDTVVAARLALKNADNYQNDKSKLFDILSSIEKQFKELGLDFQQNQEVKNAIQVSIADRDVERQKGYLRQII